MIWRRAWEQASHATCVMGQLWQVWCAMADFKCYIMANGSVEQAIESVPRRLKSFHVCTPYEGRRFNSDPVQQSSSSLPHFRRLCCGTINEHYGFAQCCRTRHDAIIANLLLLRAECMSPNSFSAGKPKPGIGVFALFDNLAPGDRLGFEVQTAKPPGPAPHALFHGAAWLSRL
jgi:hypothetical protein